LHIAHVHTKQDKNVIASNIFGCTASQFVPAEI